MIIERIRTSCVLEDSNNPRRDFGDLQELAESFMVNEANPGEPFSPPVVVRDGSMFRIVEGARRFRAMQLLGKEEFNAVVCDPIKDQDAILAMLATDNKKVLTEEELGRGVQQAIVLGVDPRKVDRASRFKRAAKVKRGMDRAGEAWRELSLEQLIAVEEAETDEEAAVIAGLDPDSWEKEVSRIKRDKAARERAEELRNYCRANSIELSDDMSGKGHKVTVNTVKLLSDFIETNGRLEGIAVKVVEEPKGGTAHASVYADVADASREDNELMERVDKRCLQLEECVDRAMEFAVSRFMDCGGELPRNMMARAVSEYVHGNSIVADFLGKYRRSVDDAPGIDGSATGLAGLRILSASRPRLTRYMVDTLMRGTAGGDTRSYAGKALDFLLAAKADGCEMPNGWGFLRDDLAQWERDNSEKKGE